ncbi:MAG TPA: hypothetical protein VFT22_07565 [Kofleriaceae bacterium]|nr:hypothetical protein [Kofleriaceae bacterium]
MIMALCVLSVALIFVAQWHGNRMYLLGVKAGREREAMYTRHARERATEAAQREMAYAAIRRVQDERLVRRWAEQAWRGGVS